MDNNTIPLNISQHIPRNATLIVGFSGGPDSICLLTLLVNLQASFNLKIIAAHLDHQWRQESAQDALWCSQFCKQYSSSVTFISKTAEQLSCQFKYNGSKEDYGRKLRRFFFLQCAQAYQASHIVLAHHQDDQIETFFIRLARGSSVGGLTCMKSQDDIFLKPLLTYSKQNMLNYLNTNHISFLTDSSNTNPLFLRNRIRMNLTNQLNAIDARFSKNIVSSINQLQQADDFIKQQAHTTLQKISHEQGIDLVQFLSLHPFLQQQILLELLIQQKAVCTISQALFKEIMRFLTSSKHNKHQLLKTLGIEKKHSHFFFKAQ